MDHKKQAGIRRRALQRAGVRYADVAALAGVSWSMVWQWIHGQKTSAKVADAYRRLAAPGRRTSSGGPRVVSMPPSIPTPHVPRNEKDFHPF